MSVVDEARSGHKLVTFDLELISYFLIQIIPFEWLYIAISFLFGDTSSEYLAHGSVSGSWLQSQGHTCEKAIACNSNTTGRKLLGLDQNICYDNARSNLELVTISP